MGLGIFILPESANLAHYHFVAILQAYRAELDTIVRQRAAMEPKLKEVQDTEADMNLLANGLESGVRA